MYESFVSDYIFWFVILAYNIGAAIDFIGKKVSERTSEEVISITAAHLNACNWLVEQSGMDALSKSKFRRCYLRIYMMGETELWGGRRL